MRWCIYCGAKVPVSSRFCIRCGHALGPATDRDQSGKGPSAAPDTSADAFTALALDPLALIPKAAVAGSRTWLKGCLIATIAATALTIGGSFLLVSALRDGSLGGSAEQSPPPAPGRSSTPPSPAPGDQNLELAGTAMLEGVRVTVTRAVARPSLSAAESAGYVVVAVEMVNGAATDRPYEPGHWSIQGPGGEAHPALAEASPPGLLGDGVLVPGGTASGAIVFQTGVAAGTYWAVWEPDSGTPGRAIWRLEV